MFDRRQFLGLGLCAALGLLGEPVSALAASAPRDRAEKKTAEGRSGKKRSTRSGSRQRPASDRGERSEKDEKRPTEASRSREATSGEAPGAAASREKRMTRPDRGAPLEDMSVQDSAPVQRRAEPVVADSGEGPQEQAVRDYLFKMRNFDAPAAGDVILTEPRQRLLNEVMARLDRLQKQVGHGWFYLLGMDEAVRTAKRPAVGEFTRQELAFLDELFHAPASSYGFMDRKPLDGFTAHIDKSRVVKVPGMGNFVYKGEAEAKWKAVQRLAGDEVVLTSGVRGVIKQFHLFLAKAQRYGGNLSLASRSLAPPGYSFHGVGDFDVGQRGFGARNFMADFTQTPVFTKLSEQGYISLRYPRDNFLGVRFEPWHVKVVDV